MAIFDRFNIRLVAAGAGLCGIALALSPNVAAAPLKTGGYECLQTSVGGVGVVDTAVGAAGGVPTAAGGAGGVPTAAGGAGGVPTAAGGGRWCHLPQRARAFLALQSLTWLVFHWLCLGPFRWPRRFPRLRRFRWVRRSRWVLRFRWVRRFRWVLRFPWVRRFPWVLRCRWVLRCWPALPCWPALRWLTWPVPTPVRGTPLVRCRLERRCPVSQFRLAPTADGAR